MIHMAMVKDVMYGKTMRKSYAKYEEILEIPNMLKIQKDSYDWFLREGLHEVFRDVAAISDYTGNLELSFRLDGKTPFEDVTVLSLPRSYTQTQEDFPTNAAGNDQKPEVKEAFLWKTYCLADPSGYRTSPYFLGLNQGSHTLELTGAKGQIAIASVRLAAFIFPQYAAMMQTDEMDFASLGERKRAIFCIIPVNDGSMNYLVSMLLTQCFQQLYLRSDERYNGRLPVPVRVIQDEWANVAQPDSYPKVLATCRSYNIGINIIVQNIHSIKALYKDEWESVIGNCDTLLFLGGGNEPTSLEFISKLLGKETVHTRTRGQTKGRSGSSSVNFQQTGRDLMTPDEIRMLPSDDALLLIRGEKPVRDKKYDIRRHHNVQRTTDGGAEPYIHNPPVPDYSLPDLPYAFRTLDDFTFLEDEHENEEN